VASHSSKIEARLETSGIARKTSPMARTRSEDWARSSSGLLLVLLPFVIFVHHHDYALQRPEVWIAFAPFALAAGAIAFVLRAVPEAVSVAMFSSFVVLFVDIEADWIDTGWRAAVLLVAIALPLWPFRQQLGRIFVFVAVIMIVATLPMSSGSGWIWEAKPSVLWSAGTKGCPS
jgi:hypothetical protein